MLYFPYEMATGSACLRPGWHARWQTKKLARLPPGIRKHNALLVVFWCAWHCHPAAHPQLRNCICICIHHAAVVPDARLDNKRKRTSDCRSCPRETLYPRALAWAFPRAAQRAAAAASVASAPSALRSGASWFLVGLVGCLSAPVVRNMASKKQSMNRAFEPLRIVNTYGAFGSVSKVRSVVARGDSAFWPVGSPQEFMFAL